MNFDFREGLAILVGFLVGADPKLAERYKAEAEAAIAAQKETQATLDSERASDIAEDSNYEAQIADLKAKLLEAQTTIAGYEGGLKAVLDQFGLTEETPTEEAS